ncbi:DNA adenine methylase [Rhodoplanes sp. TEM]|uniref:site-specific DNA-methyltransferase (adenine-specific) n=1 Tax=Rhodoplanes tepidamans TaxID=200616 RepID=A0ABT5J723_RHOTP|nr:MULTISPECIES: DNA adenine methylase [Rhodoplanes]MDC7785089.1 DNA adenine methylase [Rhodoplanes tepidamans]MDC7982563.1 DNA adenine methylase [Rhodoplanes sp. TEM]MDQ0356579.1 DNA adenine methylase [Rhodoplanes tepidamans]
MITSPLRYPGGKAKLFPFFVELIRENRLFGAEYCEPYAGGAGLAIRLLVNGFVDRISINDIDQSIYSFWVSALFNTEKFCRLIERTPVDIDQWHRQLEIWEAGDFENKLELGFSAYFLNRTNRSGIIEGAGPIGGYAQKGSWKIDVRLVKEKQIENLKALSRYANQIRVTNADAFDFFGEAVGYEKSFIYLDPPYFVKGHKLYKNFYRAEDHLNIAAELKRRRKARWVVSYDNVPEIRDAYSSFAPITYLLNYSAGEKNTGSEVIFLSDALRPPQVAGFSIGNVRRAIRSKPTRDRDARSTKAKVRLTSKS